MLGAFDNPQELDRPDLNKCPDCECFFAQDECPLCGKICPPEMRAGNRKPPKKEKRRRDSSGRVTFIEWYHSWWFIILMMFFMPIVGIILLVTSPHKKSHKITFTAIACVYMIVSTIGIGNIIAKIVGIWDKPVDTSLTREEYIAECVGVDAEEYYRRADSHKGEFVTMELVVKKKITDADGYYEGMDYITYYLCEDMSGSFTVMIRDCIQDEKIGFVAGDVITVYGEAEGNVTVYDMEYVPHTEPCINVAYAILAGAN